MVDTLDTLDWICPICNDCIPWALVRRDRCNKNIWIRASTVSLGCCTCTIEAPRLAYELTQLLIKIGRETKEDILKVIRIQIELYMQLQQAAKEITLIQLKCSKSKRWRRKLL